MQHSENDRSTDGAILKIRAGLAQAAERFAADMRIPLPTEHDASCPAFCPGPESHTYGAIARTLHDVAVLHEALARAMMLCGAAIGGEQLQKMVTLTAAEPLGE